MSGPDPCGRIYEETISGHDISYPVSSLYIMYNILYSSKSDRREDFSHPPVPPRQVRVYNESPDNYYMELPLRSSFHDPIKSRPSKLHNRLREVAVTHFNSDDLGIPMPMYTDVYTTGVY